MRFICERNDAERQQNASSVRFAVRKVAVGERAVAANWETDEFLAPTAEHATVCRNASWACNRMERPQGEPGTYYPHMRWLEA